MKGKLPATITRPEWVPEDAYFADGEWWKRNEEDELEVLTPPKKRARTTKAKDPARALVEAIAMDIGKEIVAYVEVMYPQAITATSSTFTLSLRNSIYNEIMAAIDVNEEGQIIARLQKRKKWRRKWVAIYRKLRKGAE